MTRATWVLWVGVAALYALLAPDVVLGGDNAEFVTLAARTGVAHPSGYPLHVLLSRGLSALIPAGPILAASLATALVGVAQVAALERACRAWGARPAVATLAAALFAVSPLALHLNTHAEVFALNGLLAALILGLAAPASPWRGARRGLALAALAGLALANHLSCVTLAPVGLFGVYLAWREAAGRERALLALGAPLALLAPLGLYFTLLLPPDDPSLVWGVMQGPEDVLHHALRRDYGTLQLSAQGGEARVGANLLLLAGSVGGAAAVAALGLALRRQERAGWALAAAALVSGPLFISRFNINPDTLLGGHVVERFHMLPLLVLTPLAALGLQEALARLPASVRALGERRGAAALLGAVATAAVLLAGLPGLQARHSPAVDHYLRAALGSAPPKAVLLGTGDHRVFGLRYLQRVEGLRPDVICIDYALLPYPWYQAEIARLLGDGAPLIPPGEGPASVRMATRLLATGRPLHLLTTDMPAILASLPSHPAPMGIRVLPPGQVPPPPEALLIDLARAYQALDLDYPRPHLEDGWAAEVHLRYAEPWLAIASALQQTGHPDLAQQAAQQADALAPLDTSAPGSAP